MKIDKLLIKVNGNHNYDNPEFALLDEISNLVGDYEEKHYPIGEENVRKRKKMLDLKGKVDVWEE